MNDADKEEYLKFQKVRQIAIARTILRTWNGGQGFGDEYFKTVAGKKILEAVEQALMNDTNLLMERLSAKLAVNAED